MYNNYRNYARKLLDRLNNTNYIASPYFQFNTLEEDIIESIVNECKCTITYPFIKKYESEISKYAVDGIVRELLRNGASIPKEIMNFFIFSNGNYSGFNTDAKLVKGIDSESCQYIPLITIDTIDDRHIHDPDMNQALQDLYTKYARELLFEDSRRKSTERCITTVNKFTLFKQKLINKKFTQDDFYNQYLAIISKYSSCKDIDFLQNSALSKTESMYSISFKQNILNRFKNGTAITLLEDKEKKISAYEKALHQITAEIQEELSLMPDLTSYTNEIIQIKSDIEAQLKAYSISLFGKSSSEIEEIIKRINQISLAEDKNKYTDINTGYRTAQVGFGKDDRGTKLLDVQHISVAMKYLADDIYDLINTSSELSDEEYLKRATELSYRFIRIHPFPDSNGRTSRALLNMISLERNILIPFSKENKDSYMNAMNTSHVQVGFRDDNGYLESLYSNPKIASDLEHKYTQPICDFVLSKAKKPVDTSSKSNDRIVDCELDRS